MSTTTVTDKIYTLGERLYNKRAYNKSPERLVEYIRETIQIMIDLPEGQTQRNVWENQFMLGDPFTKHFPDAQIREILANVAKMEQLFISVTPVLQIGEGPTYMVTVVPKLSQ